MSENGHRSFGSTAARVGLHLVSRAIGSFGLAWVVYLVVDKWGAAMGVAILAGTAWFVRSLVKLVLHLLPPLTPEQEAQFDKDTTEFWQRFRS